LRLSKSGAALQNVAATPHPIRACVLECAGASALSIDHALFDACIGIDSAVAQKWPVRALFVNASPIDLRGQNFFAIDRPFCNDFAVRPAHKTLPPKFNAIPTGRRFMPDAVRHRYVTPVGNRMTTLNCFPGGMLCRAELPLLTRMPADCRRIKNNLSAPQR